MRILVTVGLLLFSMAAPTLSAGALSLDTLALQDAAPGVAASTSPDLIRELLRFFGRLHPMIVHFPVALLVCAGMLEMLALFRPSTRGTARVFLYIGAASSIVAAGMGWLIAAHEPHGRAVARIMEVHRWTGIATAVFAVIAAALAAIEARRSRPTLAAAYRYALFAAVLSVSFAGHMGGALVYGEDYALRAFSFWRDAEKKPKPPLPPPLPESPANAAEVAEGDPTGDEPQGAGAAPDATTPDAIASDPIAVDFATQIQPIFEAWCYECHGPDEQEGDLALHKRGGLFHDDPELWAVLPGKPDESLLVEMIEYPADDPDFMPSEGVPLSPEAIALIRRWIAEGANWP